MYCLEQTKRDVLLDKTTQSYKKHGEQFVLPCMNKPFTANTLPLKLSRGFECMRFVLSLVRREPNCSVPRASRPALDQMN